HWRIETDRGDRSKLFAGDRIVCALGRRYATALLEGEADLTGRATDDACHYADLLSASGLCGRVVQRSERTGRPTRLRVLGPAIRADGPLTLRAFALPRAPTGLGAPAWLRVVGSAMDSGKTTACAAVINGLVRAGYRAGAAKLTGTASARDVGSYRDAGADPVFDFLDAGWPSTAGCDLDDLLAVVTGLIGHLAVAGVDVAVLEIADG